MRKTATFEPLFDSVNAIPYRSRYVQDRINRGTNSGVIVRLLRGLVRHLLIRRFAAVRVIE